MSTKALFFSMNPYFQFFEVKILFITYFKHVLAGYSTQKTVYIKPLFWEELTRHFVHNWTNLTQLLDF